ncbi:Insulin-like growth factor binding protein 3 [Mactra antiquata]
MIRQQCELVREPGFCSCCYKCAIEEGENCGLNLGRCRRALSCRALPGDADPWGAIQSGRAVCQRTNSNTITANS